MAQRGTVAFKTVEELQTAVDQYFSSRVETVEETDKDGNTSEKITGVRPFTMSGLAMAIGVARNTLLNYRSSDKFAHVIGNARRRVEEYAEEALFYSQSSRGAQFTLTVNHGWHEPQPGDGSSETESALVMNQIPPTTNRKAIAKFDGGE